MSIISIPTSKQGKQALVAAAGGVLVAVAVAAGVAIRQVGDRSNAGTTAVSSTAVVAPEAAAVPAPAGTTITSGPATTVLYLVDSSEEQSLIQGFIEQMNQQQVLAGVQPVKSSVLVGLPIDPAALDQLPGMPGARIVDLRAHAAEGVTAAQAPAPTTPGEPVAVDTLGGMAELYREQQTAAEQHRTRGTCGEDAQPVTC